MGLRVHVAVTGGRECLDTEVEIVEVSAARHIGDRLISDPIEKSKNRVEGDKDDSRAGNKGWPGCRHAAMADVLPETEVQSLGDDLAVANANHAKLRFFLFSAVGHAWIASVLNEWRLPCRIAVRSPTNPF